MNMPDIEIPEAYLKNPEDVDLLRQCVLDRNVPYDTHEFNRFLKTLSPQELYMLYHSSAEQLFYWLYDPIHLGEPIVLKRARVSWEMSQGKQGDLFEEEEWDPWAAWCLILKKKQERAYQKFLSV